ncbi:MAG: 16S rRNA (cytidine(1402)-2'-O)-methyltransferase [Sandaracinaceae bacterium]|nr:16S rRNA (cytidine(1402)-2'-O)-methyltransferase [Sandaracinaceae bacterium]MDW8246646.1 16S rRNA (cytidine(1402)-2'-O)-methyltransferase [Sandaracinaceae bacterium]
MSKNKAPIPAGRLFLVATPIGNLEDITLRAIRVLRESDCILAEDTRRTRILLEHHGITKPLRSYHAHSSRKRLEEIIQALLSGQRVAFVSDAGSPLISDPGVELVAEARKHQIPVEAVPGPSAPIAALMAAGYEGSRFRFLGFLPRSGSRRERALAMIAAESDAVVFFESPERLAETLFELASWLGDREVAVCRELTKLHEEVLRGRALELSQALADCRGEVTVVVAPSLGKPHEEERFPQALVNQCLSVLSKKPQPLREAARLLTQLTGMPVKEAYRLLLNHRLLGHMPLEDDTANSERST